MINCQDLGKKEKRISCLIPVPDFKVQVCFPFFLRLTQRCDSRTLFNLVIYFYCSFIQVCINCSVVVLMFYDNRLAKILQGSGKNHHAGSCGNHSSSFFCRYSNPVVVHTVWLYAKPCTHFSFHRPNETFFVKFNLPGFVPGSFSIIFLLNPLQRLRLRRRNKPASF